MKVLIVGAGSVGLVYGYYFHLAGHTVTFFIKKKYHDQTSKGFKLFPLNKGKNPEALSFNEYSVISDIDQVEKINWDIVTITLPSDAIYTPWTADFASRVNKNAIIISLQPGAYDRQEICKFFPGDKVISGMITLIAFATPLGVEGPSEKGMAYWFPPFLKAPFDGPKNEVKIIVKALKESGFPATEKNFLNNPSQVVFPSSFLAIFVRFLELNDWRLSLFYNPQFTNSLRQATKEAFQVIAKNYSVSPPLISELIRTPLISLILKLCVRFMPFDLNKYFKNHFSKVAPQMKRNRMELLLEARKYNLSTPMLEDLDKN